LPNALPLPDPLPAPERGGPFTFLFIGTLGYYPNEDAIVYFCTQVLPLIRERAPREVRVIIAGSGATPALQQLVGTPGVELIGPVPDVATAYREAHAVVVPIRAGGGTRIKVLEAFSYRRPVIATSVGIEGIAAEPDQHYLRGDTPRELADQCLRLLDDPGLAERLADAAHALFTREYTIQAAADRLTGCESDTAGRYGDSRAES
jgi:glycosyltransferase involved in cell wall biosynthesis